MQKPFSQTKCSQVINFRKINIRRLLEISLIIRNYGTFNQTAKRTIRSGRVCNC